MIRRVGEYLPLVSRYILNVPWRKLFQKDRKCARVHDRAEPLNINGQSFVECTTIYPLFPRCGARVGLGLFRANDPAGPFTRGYVLRKGACALVFFRLLSAPFGFVRARSPALGLPSSTLDYSHEKGYEIRRR